MPTSRIITEPELAQLLDALAEDTTPRGKSMMRFVAIAAGEAALAFLSRPSAGRHPEFRGRQRSGAPRGCRGAPTDRRS